MSKTITDIIKDYYDNDFVPSRVLEITSNNKGMIESYFNKVKGTHIFSYNIIPLMSTIVNVSRGTGIIRTSYKLKIEFDKRY